MLVKSPHFSSSQGMSLLELMVVVAIMGILVAGSTSSISAFFAQQKVKASAAVLQSTLMAARQEAIKRGKPVSFCPSSDGALCQSSWSAPKGLLMFVGKTAGDASANKVLYAAFSGAPAMGSSANALLSFNRAGALMNGLWDVSGVPDGGADFVFCPSAYSSTCTGGVKVLTGVTGAITRSLL